MAASTRCQTEGKPHHWTLITGKRGGGGGGGGEGEGRGRGGLEMGNALRATSRLGYSQLIGCKDTSKCR